MRRESEDKNAGLAGSGFTGRNQEQSTQWDAMWLGKRAGLTELGPITSRSDSDLRLRHKPSMMVGGRMPKGRLITSPAESTRGDEIKHFCEGSCEKYKDEEIKMSSEEVMLPETTTSESWFSESF